jgi:hypothetical protein
MTAQVQSGTGPDIWTAGGPWRFSRERLVTGPAAQSLYGLYRRAFDPLRPRAAARQVLSEQEFMAQMADERIDKYLAWETEAAPVGVITLTRELEAIPWISPEYYAACYPDHWARNAIYYLGYILISPGVRRTGFLETVTRLLVKPMAEERAVLVYDVCSYNNQVLGFSKLIAETFRRCSNFEPKELDAQVYYGVDFA